MDEDLPLFPILAAPGGPRIREPREFVLSAVEELRDPRSCRMKNIISLVSSECNATHDAEEIRRQVRTALKRGVQYGLISCDKGCYRLQDLSGRRTDLVAAGDADAVVGPDAIPVNTVFIAKAGVAADLVAESGANALNYIK